MKSEEVVIHKGLEGVYVDRTSISHIDGEKGLLSYRGYRIEELVKREFSEVAYLVVYGEWPSQSEKICFEEFLFENSQLNQREIDLIANVDATTHPMKVLQGVVPLLKLGEEKEDLRGLQLAAKLPSLLAAYHRLRNGREVIPGKRNLCIHENFLYCWSGQLPKKEDVEVLNTTQILQMEHGFNASAFAARVTASSLAPVESAISSAIGTLFGKLHGGADQAALEMALEVADPSKAEEYFLKCLKDKKKIMGMGHREYRVVDPRAVILKPLAKRLCEETPFMSLYQTLEKVEELMDREMLKKGKGIKANIEFYKGPVFYALGIAPEYFTALFAMSRIFGYLAHILESRVENRIFRPKGFYVGMV